MTVSLSLILRELLANNGSWCHVDGLVRGAARFVQPERAARVARYYNAKNDTRLPDSIEAVIRTGQRFVILGSLNAMKQKGTVKSRGYGRKREFRLVAKDG